MIPQFNFIGKVFNSSIVSLLYWLKDKVFGMELLWIFGCVLDIDFSLFVYSLNECSWSKIQHCSPSPGTLYTPCPQFLNFFFLTKPKRKNFKIHSRMKLRWRWTPENIKLRWLIVYEIEKTKLWDRNPKS